MGWSRISSPRCRSCWTADHRAQFQLCLQGTLSRYPRGCEELGVRYVLEGSVRKSGNRIRITAQLIDAKDGTHFWAERYDRAIDDIFAIQDEITLVLATEMQVKLTEGEQARLRYTTTNNVEAWTYWVQGLSHFHHGAIKENWALRDFAGKRRLRLIRARQRSKLCLAYALFGRPLRLVGRPRNGTG